MACPHQDPDWWKRTQLLLAGDLEATRDPCSTVLYVHIKSPHIKPPSNAIISPLIGFTSNPTHPYSYVTHIKSQLQKLPLTYTTQHKKPPHTRQQTKPTTQNQSTLPLTPLQQRQTTLT